MYVKKREVKEEWENVSSSELLVVQDFAERTLHEEV